MTVDAIRELRQADPFRPFELLMASGDTHKVREPEDIALGGSRFVVGDSVADRIDILLVADGVGHRLL